MISLKSPGSFKKTMDALSRMGRDSIFDELDRYGRLGVDALSSATPKRTGETASSWGFDVVNKRGQYGIEWYNNNINKGVVIAILIQYGHGTGTGGYVSGFDYINPAIRPIFDEIANDIWKKVTE